MTQAEKADLVTGKGMWDNRPIERLGIPSMIVTDGPNGARGGGLLGTGTPTACIPAGSVLGATWDPDLVERLGGLLGDECQAKGAGVLLAPTINLHRNPLGGRNFECYSEDPFLTGRIAVGFVRGVQSRNVATTAKHFVGNDSEFERNSIDTQADERTLREVYLAPFEQVVKYAKGWGIMSSYNRLNGTFASEHVWLMQTVLRDQWGFDGFVVSDWFAARSTAESIKAGMSLEMPGPGKFYGPAPIAEALKAEEITEDDLDAIALDMLRLLERTETMGRAEPKEEEPLDRPEDRLLVREAAAAGTVLVKNDGVLPLDAASLSSLAVIGPNARIAKVMGGGSATVRAYRATSPLDALNNRFGNQIDVTFAPGCDIDRSTPPLDQALVPDGFNVEFFANHDLEGEPVHQMQAGRGQYLYFGKPAAEVPVEYSLRSVGTIVPEITGAHSVRLVQCGRARVLINGEVIVDAFEGDYERGDEYFGFASIEIPGDIELTAGEPAEIVIEFSSKDALLLSGARVGIRTEVERDLLGDAEKAATTADAAVVVVGTNDDWETEGRDRDSFILPGDQVELIRRVSAANSRTIVAVNTGGPFSWDWLDAPAAALNVGFGGQELGDALVDVLFGEVDPGGRMPTTIPARYEHSPAFLNYPGENSVVRYGEGLHIGHRWFDARHIEPAVAFGHGMSYATFEWSEPRMAETAPTALGEVSPATAGAPGDASDTDGAEVVTVEVDVTNTSDRAGVDVVQIYIEPPESVVHRPVRELKGFAKVAVAPGATETAKIVLDRRAFAYFDPGDQVFEELAAGMPVPAALGKRHTGPGWYVEPGEYRVVVARSSQDFAHTATITLEGEELRFSD